MKSIPLAASNLTHALKLSLLCIALHAGMVQAGALSPARIFSDGNILQWDMPVAVWPTRFTLRLEPAPIEMLDAEKPFVIQFEKQQAEQGIPQCFSAIYNKTL